MHTNLEALPDGSTLPQRGRKNKLLQLRRKEQKRQSYKGRVRSIPRRSADVRLTNNSSDHFCWNVGDYQQELAFMIPSSYFIPVLSQCWIIVGAPYDEREGTIKSPENPAHLRNGSERNPRTSETTAMPKVLTSRTT